MTISYCGLHSSHPSLAAPLSLPPGVKSAGIIMAAAGRNAGKIVSRFNGAAGGGAGGQVNTAVAGWGGVMLNLNCYTIQLKLSISPQLQHSDLMC